MSELRRQLGAGRAEHRAAKYPGDLAGELLPAARRGTGAWRRTLWVGGVAGAALAAGIAVVVLLNRPGPPGPVTPPVTDNGVEVAMGVLEMPEKPGMPDERPEMPPYQALTDLGARPGMPSFFELSSSAGDAEEQL